MTLYFLDSHGGQAIPTYRNFILAFLLFFINLVYTIRQLTEGVSNEKYYPIPLCGVLPIHHYESIACPMDPNQWPLWRRRLLLRRLGHESLCRDFGRRLSFHQQRHKLD